MPLPAPSSAIAGADFEGARLGRKGGRPDDIKRVEVNHGQSHPLGFHRGTTQAPIEAAGPRLRALCDADEAALLRLFEQPQVFGEALFDRPELQKLDEPRVFLARCLRLEILVEVPDA